jgi:thioredoxin reductase
MGTERWTATLRDVAVIGGGPAGLSAALWAARYRRSVLLVDAGEQRNASVDATHGYLGLEGVSPIELIDRSMADVSRYPEITVRHGVSASNAAWRDGAFELALEDGTTARALRLVLCTGVRDLFPDIDGFHRHFGSSVFTCPSCDGYEARKRHVVVIGDDEHTAPFAVGLLDWAASVTVVIEDPGALGSAERSALSTYGISVVAGKPTAFVGQRHALQAVSIGSDQNIPADVVFCTVPHKQRSEMARELGCDISDEGCVVVDDHCSTSVEHVYAAGDMTPGPHLVQVAAAKGATAGIAAALSLRGDRGAPTSPAPAPDPDAAVVASSAR